MKGWKYRRFLFLIRCKGKRFLMKEGFLFSFNQCSVLFTGQPDVSGECQTRQLLILSNNVRSSLVITTTVLMNSGKCTTYLFDLVFLSSVDIPQEGMVRTPWKLQWFAPTDAHTGTWSPLHSGHNGVICCHFWEFRHLRLSNNKELKIPALPDYFFLNR